MGAKKGFIDYSLSRGFFNFLTYGRRYFPMNIINVLWLTKKWFFYDILRQSPGINFSALIQLSSKIFTEDNILRVAWILCGDINVGSSRIHGINIHNYLKKNNCNSYILYKPKGYSDSIILNPYTKKLLLKSNADIVLFQRVHKGSAETLVEKLKKSGKKTVFLMADYYETIMPGICDRVIVVSDYLRQQLVTRGIEENKILVIPDAIETPGDLHKQNYSGEVPYKIVWVGAEGHWDSLTVVRKALADPDLRENMQLITISNHPESTYRWELSTVWDNILRCDIAVIPADSNEPKNLTKSSNRLTMFKALGMPVICSPLPEYESIIQHGQNGFLARDVDEWIHALKKLLSREIRQRIGTTGREEIFLEFGIECIGKKYLDFLHTLK